MYRTEKKFMISAAHRLPDYPGDCSAVHGHNWNITVTCESEELDELGMVLDFKKMKKLCAHLDHAEINAFVENPTAEKIAKYIHDRIPNCVMVSVEETEGSIATYFK